MIKDENFVSDGFLTADKVNDIYRKCVRNQKANFETVTIEGWLDNVIFSIKQLKLHREDIIKLLLCLDPNLRIDEKGGGSAISLVKRADGSIWSEDMNDIDRLISLGMGIGLVSFCATREAWHLLPGGLPYVRIDITKFGVSAN